LGSRAGSAGNIGTVASMIRSSIRHDKPSGGRVKPEPRRKDKGRQDVPAVVRDCHGDVAGGRHGDTCLPGLVCHVCRVHCQRCFSRRSCRVCLDYGTGDRLPCTLAALGPNGIDHSPAVWSKSWEDESERRDQPLLPRPKPQNTVEDGGFRGVRNTEQGLVPAHFFGQPSRPVRRHRGLAPQA
jgi:hypothetical protein